MRKEETCQVTRGILKQLLHAECELGISTKSSLILRDLDLLTQFKNLKVSLSINSLDEKFREDMDHVRFHKGATGNLENLT